MIDDMYRIFDRIDTLKKRFGLLRTNTQQATTEKTKSDNDPVPFNPIVDASSETEKPSSRLDAPKKEAMNRAEQIKQASLASVIQTLTSSAADLSPLQKGMPQNNANLVETLTQSYRDVGDDDSSPAPIIDTRK